MKIRYNPKLKAHARELRKQGILSEVLLWEHLKSRKMRGYQFMRQKPVGDYIVDFYCSKLKLAMKLMEKATTEDSCMIWSDSGY